MSKWLKMVLVTALVLLLTPISGVAAKEPVEINIIHTNDVHGKTDMIAKLATYKKSVKNAILVDAGDASQGDSYANFSSGKLMFELMKLANYDAMTFGNHEFDFGYDALMTNIKTGGFPMISANVRYAKTGKYVGVPYLIKEVEGVKIAFFGLTSQDAMFKADPAVMKNFVIDNPITTAKTMVNQLKGKADLIFAVTHLGVNDEGYYTSNDLSNQVAGLNGIIDGHSHTPCPVSKACLVNGPAVIYQNASANGSIRQITINYTDKNNYSITSKDVLNQVKAAKDDEAVAAKLADIKKELDPTLNKVAGKVTTDLYVGRASNNDARGSVRTNEVNTGNLITDAFRTIGKVDIAMVNGGNIRNNSTTNPEKSVVKAKELTVNDVLGILTFSNEIVTIDADAKLIKAVLEHSVSLAPKEHGGFMHVSGLTFKYDSSKPVGERVIEILVGGNPIDEKKIYTVALPAFTKSGGDNYTMLAPVKTKGFLNPATDNQILIEYLKTNPAVPAVEGRIVDVAVKK